MSLASIERSFFFEISIEFIFLPCAYSAIMIDLISCYAIREYLGMLLNTEVLEVGGLCVRWTWRNDEP